MNKTKPVHNDLEGPRVWKVFDIYERLYKNLLQLNDALQKIEPDGKFVDQATFKRDKGGKMHVIYKVRPLQLVIEDKGKRFRVRVEEIK